MDMSMAMSSSMTMPMSSSMTMPMSSSMTMAMSMPMSTASSAMAMSTGMPMSSSSGMSGGMDMSDSMMPMSAMMMVFFTSTSTPLYSSDWMPASTGAYAGTCIFLVAFSVVFHSLLAVRSNFDKFFGWATHKRETEILRSDYDKVGAAGLPGNAAAPRRPWRINEAVVRALLDTVLAGVGYLLMLAVMTMNVGYFLSVLGGVFLGSFIFGGFTSGVHAGH